MYIDKYMQCLQFVFISFLPASTYVFNLDSITSHKIEEKIFVTDFFFFFSFSIYRFLVYVAPTSVFTLRRGNIRHASDFFLFATLYLKYTWHISHRRVSTKVTRTNANYPGTTIRLMHASFIAFVRYSSDGIMYIWDVSQTMKIII